MTANKVDPARRSRNDCFPDTKATYAWRIDPFVATHNTNCQPFKRTATADSILEKLRTTLLTD